MRTTTPRWPLTTLVVVQVVVALTSVAGGVALIASAVDARATSGWTPPPDALRGSPFDSYLVPGLVLLFVVGGLHGVGAVALRTGRTWALFLASAAGYSLLVWIFVQMMFIEFSGLQAVYFGAGLLELGLVLLLLGVVPSRAARRGSHRRASAPASSR